MPGGVTDTHQLHRMKPVLFLIAGIAAATAILTSCGSGTGEGNSARGPFDASAFVGSVVSFNPTLRFFAAGNLEYSNEATSPFYGTDFPETTAGSPAAGTYTYTPSSDFQTGTLTINVPSLSGYTVDISVTDFVSVNGVVQRFKLNFPTEGTFDAVIESGSIPAAPDPSGNNSSDFVFGPDGNLVAGTTITKAYQGGTSTILEDASFLTPFQPRNFGEVATFSISGSGEFEIPAIDPFFGGPYTIRVPFLQASNGIISWKGVDARANGPITVNMETKRNGVLSILWEEDVVTGGAYDFERQIWK